MSRFVAYDVVGDVDVVVVVVVVADALAAVVVAAAKSCEVEELTSSSFFLPVALNCPNKKPLC